ncbi:Bug family tripartite tricarboxylate transporter substrate binding protein [Falsiroseomonas oryzae]|uniref:Bug family tripartite tricarboxylate transporter substrate binding protein n=1 Tax=Falsiroseomonas oryzae TaxID=2766473 RepID=UPI0022EB7722|nr:tripartite tricarboxylate transporter substrate binding protein [Roseomonas sp. MO-31]
MIERRRALAGAAALLSVAPRVAMAQAYPSRPMRLIVPFAPGGSTDIIGRFLAREAGQLLGQPIVVENRPGAGAMIGLNELVQARPDGYTIGMTNSGMVFQPLYGHARFNYATELQAIAQVGEIPFVFAVKADAPWRTLTELVEWSRARPGQLMYGITGYGNTSHIGPEKLRLAANLQIEAVNFPGGGPLIASLLGGHIHAISNNPVDLRDQIRNGNVRVLCAFAENRLEDPSLRDIPTAREFGYDIVVTLWQGVGAPRGMPEQIIQRLDTAFGELLNTPAAQAAVREYGLQPRYLNAAAFQRKWVEDQQRQLQTITETGIIEVVRRQTR